MGKTSLLGMRIPVEKHGAYRERAVRAGYMSVTQWVCDVLDGRVGFDETKDGEPAMWFLDNERHLGASEPPRRGRPPGRATATPQAPFRPQEDHIPVRGPDTRTQDQKDRQMRYDLRWQAYQDACEADPTMNKDGFDWTHREDE